MVPFEAIVSCVVGWALRVSGWWIYIIQRILPQTRPRGIAITPPPLALDNENDMPAMFLRVRDCCWWIDRSNAGLEWAVKIGGVDVCTEVEPHRTQLPWSWYITREIWRGR